MLFAFVGLDISGLVVCWVTVGWFWFVCVEVALLSLLGGVMLTSSIGLCGVFF